jgi:hypothetical protein
MHALPRNQRFLLHPKDYAVPASNDRLENLARLVGNWDGNGIGVIFVDQLKVEHDGERWWQFDLLTGITEAVALTPGTRAIVDQTISYRVALLGPRLRCIPYSLEPGQAFINWQRISRPPVVKVNMTANRPTVVSGANAVPNDSVTIYIDRWFLEGDASNDDLDVARDAWFGADYKRAEEIAEKIIPHSFDLWLACIKLEFNLLQERTAASGG